MVEVELNNSHTNGLLIPFAIFTSILIFIHLFALMVATHILPELDALSAIPHVQLTRRPGNVAQAFCVKLTWFLSHGLGIILFLVQFVLLAFVKFYPFNDDTEERYEAAIAAGVVIIVLTVVFAVATLLWYYHSYVHHNVKGHHEALHVALTILQQLNASDPLHPANRVQRVTVV